MLGTGLLRKLGLANRVEAIRRLVSPAASKFTVFHITHHKAGSQWINGILHACACSKLIPPEVEVRQFLQKPVENGVIYPTLYITREQFASVAVPRHWRRFVIIRDLRDTLVSLYFSQKFSHELHTPFMRERRTILNEMTQEQGLLYLTGCGLAPMAQVQWSWLAAREDVIKYEDLLQNDEEILTRVLLGKCRLAVDRKRFRDIVHAYRFEHRSGRKPGVENTHEHNRKGIAGDWRNYFTDSIRAEFKRCYGSLLVATGYEKGFNW